MADGDAEMGAVLACGRVSNKPVPKKGKNKPDPPPKKPKTYKLKAKLRQGTTNVSGAKVTVDGADVNSNNSGVSDFGKKAAGPYTLTVAFGADSDYLDITTPININLGADTEVPVAVQLKNIVSVKIEPEFKTIPYDRKLSDHQAGTETKVVTGICCVKLTFEQSNTAHPYAKKATFSCGAAADLFTDEACTAAFDGNIANAQIVGGLPTKYYLKTKTAGRFNATVTFEAPADTKVKLKKATATEPMSVAEVKLKIFKNDVPATTNKKNDQDLQPISKFHDNLKKYEIPEQTEMSDVDKVQKGRFLHLQSDGNHGRAKIVLKIDPAQWLDECNDYELYLAPVNVTGSIEMYDAELKGNKWDKTKPIKISELKKKRGEKEFWVEGTGVTDKLLEVKLGVTLNRPAAGIAHTEKKNADWARFTVVKIDKVKVNNQPVGGEATPWDSASKKFYINFKVDPDGRKVKIHAKLTQKIAGVPIHFMLAPDKDNGTVPTHSIMGWGEKNFKTKSSPSTHEWKWNSLGADLKEKDRVNRNDFLHMMKETDAEGEAEMELILLKFGGDKYTPGCYISEDPHLAKYIHGHSDLQKKKPTLCADTIEVSRKFWYELVKVPGVNGPALTTAENIYTLTKAEMIKATDVQVSQATVNGMVPTAIYPRYMVEVNGGNANALVVSDTNKAQFFAGCVAEADKPVKIPILICDAQWDPDGPTSEVSFDEVAATSFPRSLSMDKLMLKPVLQGGNMIVASQWTAAE